MLNVKQKGMSPVTVLFLICVFAFVLIVALKLATHYMEYFSVRSVFQEMAEDKQTKSEPIGKIKRDIYTQLAINNIRDFNLDDRAYFVNDDGDNVLGFNYEVREHMFGNIDVILTFKFETPLE